MQRRINNLLVAGVLILVLAASCSMEDEIASGSLVPVAFTTTVKGVDILNISTRVADDNWHSGDPVGIYMIKPNAESLIGSLAANRPYKTTSAGTSTSLVPVGDPVYYPADGSDVGFVAYHPYQEGMEENELVYAVDVTDQSDLSAIDLLWCKVAGDKAIYNKYYAAAPLAFEHKLCKIVITVTVGEGVAVLEAEDVLELSPVPAKQKLDIFSGEFLPFEIRDENYDWVVDIPLSESSNSKKLIWEGIIVPHEGYTGMVSRALTTWINNTWCGIDIPDTQNFESGKVYHYDMTFTSTGIALNGVTISEWESKDVEIGEPANCYMLKPGGHSVMIPVSRVNEYAQQLGESETFTTMMYWQDAKDCIKTPVVVGTGYKGYIQVTSGTTEGNAVVVVKNSSGKVLWSWHIWVTDYDPNGEDATYTNEYTYNSANYRFTFMDRHLGAKSGNPEDGIGTYGLHYQWGRKDPFPGAGTTAGDEPNIFTTSATNFGITYAMSTSVLNTTYFNMATLIQSQQTIAWTIANPQTFIGVTGSWFKDATVTDNLWGHSGGKTIFDPCPKGWRVPKNAAISADTSPWSGLGDADHQTYPNITTWGTGTAYPRTGCRQNADGKLSYTGSGYVWTASYYIASKTHATCLKYTTGGVTPFASDDRADGFSVRCVKQ